MAEVSLQLPSLSVGENGPTLVLFFDQDFRHPALPVVETLDEEREVERFIHKLLIAPGEALELPRFSRR